MERIQPAFESSSETKITEPHEGLSPTDTRLPCLTILAHPDATRVGERVFAPELHSGRALPLGRCEPEFAAPGADSGAALDSVHLSRHPCHLVMDPGSYQLTLERSGCPTPIAVDGQELKEQRILEAQEVENGIVLCLGHRVVILVHWDQLSTAEADCFGLIGESSALRRVRAEIRVAGRFDAPVLLRGESGTGKELVARAIHDASQRSQNPYLAINMAAIPGSLAASELFGARKGAFTGAKSGHEGYFQKASTGTLFLDEIGETPDEVQPLLLRVLETGEIQSVGAAQPQRVDTRVIAATDANLESLIAAGTFRAPLLHRLAGYEIRLPPLRERRSDLGRLLFHFLNLELKTLAQEDLGRGTDAAERPWPPADLIARLALYEWPGNVRQLKNTARRMAISRATGTDLQLPAEMLEPVSDRAPELATAEPGRLPTPASSPRPMSGWRPIYRKPSDVDSAELLAALRENRYELKASAESLGISRASLYTLIEADPRIRKASELNEREVQTALAQAGDDPDQAAAELEVSVYALRQRMRRRTNKPARSK